MDKIGRVIHLEISFDPCVPAGDISLIKDVLHAEAQKLTAKIAEKDKSIMSLIAVAEEQESHLVRHLT
jgi:hypothetical protein